MSILMEIFWKIASENILHINLLFVILLFFHKHSIHRAGIEGHDHLLLFSIFTTCTWTLKPWPSNNCKESSTLLGKLGIECYLWHLNLIFNPFYAPNVSLYPLKTENLWFSDVFKRYRKRPVTWNGLIIELHAHDDVSLCTYINVCASYLVVRM